MVHGPCGVLNPNAPCMVDRKCSKGYPKNYQEFTSMDRNGYPLYFRPNDGRKYKVRNHWLDNRWIVPYPPWPCVFLDCHMNAECAISIASSIPSNMFTKALIVRCWNTNVTRLDGGLMGSTYLHQRLPGISFNSKCIIRSRQLYAFKSISKATIW